MKKFMVISVCALVCLFNSCAIFVYDNDQPTAPEEHDTTTVVIID
jgi:hypothetical protein